MQLTVGQAFQEAIAKHQAGDFQKAESLYRAILSVEPGHPDANHNLGVIAVSVGKAELALSHLKCALDQNPGQPQFWLSYVGALLTLRRNDEALSLLTQATLRGVSAETLQKIKDLLNKAGLQSAYDNKPKSKAEPTEKTLNAAIEAFNNGDLQRAGQLSAELTVKYPNHPVGWMVLAKVAQKLGQIKVGLSALEKLVVISPNDSQARCDLGALLHMTGQTTEAEASYRQAIRLQPTLVAAYSNLGALLSNQKRYSEAEAAYQEALRLNPEIAEIHNNLGALYSKTDRIDDAANCYGRAIQIKADYAGAHSNLASLMMDCGRNSEAEALILKAVQLQPNNDVYQNNRLFLLNYDERLGAEALFSEYEAYGAALAAKNTYLCKHKAASEKVGNRLRIGYVSADFREHACRHFMEPLFSQHDRHSFQLYAYSNTKIPDQHTERLKTYFDHWIDVCQMDDKTMAQRIFDDGIDVLVDLSGHTAGNRLPVFAMRPAKVQITTMGYGYTTGLREIDYFLGDQNLTPPGCEQYFSERIWRLERIQCCYEPPRELTPEVSTLPALNNGYVTFGCLARLIRVNDRVLRTWGQILQRVPGSRLWLDQKPFVDKKIREAFYERLQDLGIPRSRVNLTCSKPHWDAYQQIDVTLDCFPHNAGTTLLESLWMGVPVLSKLDRPSMGRVGACILNPLGLSEWIAETEEEYVQKAVSFADNLAGLVELRATLRSRLETSELMDATGLARAIEGGYRKMIEEKNNTL